jgi:hypothetical protein
MSITGLLWARKGWPDALKQVRVTADTEGQRASYQPFTKPDWRSVYQPEAVAIETQGLLAPISNDATQNQASGMTGAFWL